MVSQPECEFREKIMAAKAFIYFRCEDEFKICTLHEPAEFRNASFEKDDKSLFQAIDNRDDT